MFGVFAAPNNFNHANSANVQGAVQAAQNTYGGLGSMPIPAREVARVMRDMTHEARCRYLRAILEFAELADGLPPSELRTYTLLVEVAIQGRSTYDVCDKAVGLFSSPVHQAKVLMCEPVLDTQEVS